jgi:hypothetical protein
MMVRSEGAPMRQPTGRLAAERLQAQVHPERRVIAEAGAEVQLQLRGDEMSYHILLKNPTGEPLEEAWVVEVAEGPRWTPETAPPGRRVALLFTDGHFRDRYRTVRGTAQVLPSVSWPVLAEEMVRRPASFRVVLEGRSPESRWSGGLTLKF